MDGFRFDHLTRLVGARLNRRTSLALIVAGVASQTPLHGRQQIVSAAGSFASDGLHDSSG